MFPATDEKEKKAPFADIPILKGRSIRGFLRYRRTDHDEWYARRVSAEKESVSILIFISRHPAGA